MNSLVAPWLGIHFHCRWHGFNPRSSHKLHGVDTPAPKRKKKKMETFFGGKKAALRICSSEPWISVLLLWLRGCVIRSKVPPGISFFMEYNSLTRSGPKGETMALRML